MDMQSAVLQTSNRAETHSQSLSKRIGKSRPTPDQRAAFFIAIDSGSPISKASDAVGINRNTGMLWARQAKVRKAEQQARSGAIATKTEVALELTRIGLHDDKVAPRDKVKALEAASKVLGYEAPARSEVTTLVIHASVRDMVQARTAARLALINDHAALNANATTLSLNPAPTKALPLVDITSVIGRGSKIALTATDPPAAPPTQAVSVTLSHSPNISNILEK